MNTLATWNKSPENPVIKWDNWGTMFDPCILIDEAPHHRYRMYLSWRPQNAIALCESDDAVTWSAPRIVMAPAALDNGGQCHINRQSVLKHNGVYHIYYSGQARPIVPGHARIYHATSKDGVLWEYDHKMVLEGSFDWESYGVMCPHVIFDEGTNRFRMWYSAMSNPGKFYEPDAIGYAESADGIVWEKPLKAPAFAAHDVKEWPLIKVTACDVLKIGDWFYMFYIGFTTDSFAQIYLARSKDGVSNWEQFPANPIVRPTPDAWDADACYKPAVCHDGKYWRLWYNGRRGVPEQIGLVTCDQPFFW
jgi:beta-1,2-mannobiose phosphorylase / 1,2-beta-oligomannan phosphorylase